MSSVWEQVRDKERRRLEAQQRLEGVEIPDGRKMILGKAPGRPMPDVWYVKMMVKRLRWEKCEDRDTVLALFRQYWPVVGRRAEEFYDMAVTLEAEEV